jgi:hypothetical protein
MAGILIERVLADLIGTIDVQKQAVSHGCITAGEIESDSTANKF